MASSQISIYCTWIAYLDAIKAQVEPNWKKYFIIKINLTWDEWYIVEQ